MKASQNINTAREIVSRHALPAFVTGFDGQLGELGGDRAMWIVFEALPSCLAGIQRSSAAFRLSAR